MIDMVFNSDHWLLKGKLIVKVGENQQLRFRL